MKTRTLSTMAVLAALVLAGCAAEAPTDGNMTPDQQIDQKTFTVEVVVEHAQNRVGNAEVTAMTHGAVAYTDHNGVATFDSLPAGPETFKVDAPTIEKPLYVDVNVGEDDAPITTETVTIDPADATDTPTPSDDTSPIAGLDPELDEYVKIGWATWLSFDAEGAQMAGGGPNDWYEIGYNAKQGAYKIYDQGHPFSTNYIDTIACFVEVKSDCGAEACLSCEDLMVGNKGFYYSTIGTVSENGHKFEFSSTKTTGSGTDPVGTDVFTLETDPDGNYFEGYGDE